MAVSAYHLVSKEVKITSSNTTEFLDTHECINNPHWQSSEIIIFLCRYHIVVSDTLIGSFLDVLFLLLAVISSELPEKPRRKKVHRRLCVRDITFLTARSPFCHFLLLSLSTPFPSQVTHLLNRPYKDA